jgi:hypothetical protein
MFISEEVIQLYKFQNVKFPAGVVSLPFRFKEHRSSVSQSEVEEDKQCVSGRMPHQEASAGLNTKYQLSIYSTPSTAGS